MLAACGLLRGRRGTHNHTPEHASHEQAEVTAALWQGLRFERGDIVHDDLLITAQGRIVATRLRSRAGSAC